MPLYQYTCKECEHTFEHFRPMSQARQDADCPECQGRGVRILSLFAAFSASGDGDSTPIAGAGGCACSAGGACACARA